MTLRKDAGRTLGSRESSLESVGLELGLGSALGISGEYSIMLQERGAERLSRSERTRSTPGFTGPPRLEKAGAEKAASAVGGGLFLEDGKSHGKFPAGHLSHAHESVLSPPLLGQH